MGLDMYAYCTENKITDIDFDTPDDAHQFATWRKHPHLHDWMEQLYRAKGGGMRCFNCVNLKLEPEDIDALESGVMAVTPPPPRGFFSESLPEDKARYRAFIAHARERFKNGDSVFYSSWW